MNAESHATAFKTRLSIPAAGSDPAVPALDSDEAQQLENSGSLPRRYIVIYVQRRKIANNARANGTFEPTGWYLSTEVNAESVTSARAVEQNVFDGLVLNPITLDGQPVDVRLETPAAAFEKDGDFYTGTTDWVYVR